MEKAGNVFTSCLSSLGVKYTKTFAESFFGEHPNKYNMLGISQMLSDYGVQNKGIRISGDKKEVLNDLETPFIAHTGGDFVNVIKIEPDKIHYHWRDKLITNTHEEFLDTFTGKILLVEADENSKEPNYKENRKKEYIRTGQQIILLTAICVSLLITYISKSYYKVSGTTLSLIVNLVGIYIGYLLVQKQMHIQSDYADKICSLFKQKDCNNVLESKAAKLWGVIGWSEVGLGYFISNVVILLFFPQLVTYMAIINVCTLPYTVWSIWFQKVKAKQWCPLCLIVQILLWAVFAVNILFGYIRIPEIDIPAIIFTGCIYLISVLMINTLVPLLSKGKQVEKIRQEINSLKVSEDVFLAALKKQPHYKVDKSTSRILFGSKESKTLITVFTNPHCEPCARMHQRIEKLQTTANNSFCFQYIYSSFNEELEISNQFLIENYLTNPENYQTVYSDWFKDGKYKKEDFFEKYNFKRDATAVLDEFHSHNQWKEETKLRATPTILINGYELPNNYKIEDLRYFTHLVIDTK